MASSLSNTTCDKMTAWEEKCQATKRACICVRVLSGTQISTGLCNQASG